MGDLVKKMLESGVKLGVSSRGSGNVDDSNGRVSDFEIVTVDVVAQPSAPNAYPVPIYESLLNHSGGMKIAEMLKDPAKTPKAQKLVEASILNYIKGLKLN